MSDINVCKYSEYWRFGRHITLLITWCSAFRTLNSTKIFAIGKVLKKVLYFKHDRKYTVLPLTMVIYQKKKVKLYFQVSGNNQCILLMNNAAPLSVVVKSSDVHYSFSWILRYGHVRSISEFSMKSESSEYKLFCCSL